MVLKHFRKSWDSPGSDVQVLASAVELMFFGKNKGGSLFVLDVHYGKSWKCLGDLGNFDPFFNHIFGKSWHILDSQMLQLGLRGL